MKSCFCVVLVVRRHYILEGILTMFLYSLRPNELLITPPH